MYDYPFRSIHRNNGPPEAKDQQRFDERFGNGMVKLTSVIRPRFLTGPTRELPPP
jgi:hypothetical protein